MPTKKSAKAPATASLLVEILTEELPPRALRLLGEVFARELTADLKLNGFLADTSTHTFFATPRRLAVLVTEVAEQARDKEDKVKGPSVSIGLDSNGKPTPALIGFAKKRGIPVERLERVTDGKQEIFIHRDLAKGGRLDTNLDLKVEAALDKLPSPKMMRWGNGDAQFARPAHGLVMMHGSRVVAGSVLGLTSGNTTLGHRFLSKGAIKIPAADRYEATLEKQGVIIPSFDKRKQLIRTALAAAAKGSKPLWDDALLDEVTALVEFPAVYRGTFSPEFLSVPQECLVLSMKQHQRYFPLRDENGKLLPKFLIVGNLAVKNPQPIVHGNERVLRARLADAKFFYDQDRRTRLEARVPKLAAVVHHNKLGNQLERVERVQLLAGNIARELGADAMLAERAAWLCKADLLTDMVGEFPELQGVMGRCYALHDGEPAVVADAIESHYRPRFAGDALPAGKVACAVALADKLEILAGMFGIGQQPTGDKDPHALRRHALGVVRMLVESGCALSLHDLVNAAFAAFPRGSFGGAQTDVQFFLYERLRGYLRDAGYSANEVEAVLCMEPARLDQIPQRLAAVRAFAGLPEAQSLAAANKRVANILRQAGAKGEAYANAEADRLKEPAERKLFDALGIASRRASTLFKQGDFTGYLKTFAVLKAPVDAFFDSVMVMVEAPELRHNRLALLADLRREMNRVADLSKLAVEK